MMRTKVECVAEDVHVAQELILFMSWITIGGTCQAKGTAETSKVGRDLPSFHVFNHFRPWKGQGGQTLCNALDWSPCQDSRSKTLPAPAALAPLLHSGCTGTSRSRGQNCRWRCCSRDPAGTQSRGCLCLWTGAAQEQLSKRPGANLTKLSREDPLAVVLTPKGSLPHA